MVLSCVFLFSIVILSKILVFRLVEVEHEWRGWQKEARWISARACSKWDRYAEHGWMHSDYFRYPLVHGS
jgi:hypothetical protein